MQVDRLKFQRIDVSARSAAVGELAPDCRKGIYFYLFDDGSAYVGKSIDMVKRHAQHLHEYRHRDDSRVRARHDARARAHGGVLSARH